jgi:long-subunit acyl-CoA synthetase (AMP-forming)
MAVSGPIAVPMTHPRTLPRLFEASVERFPGLAMMLEKRGDRYEGTTYAQMRPRVHRFAAGLLSLGLAAGDRVALVAEGRNDWVMAELGILYCGAVNVPISVKIDELADLAFRLRHAGCRMVIVSRSQVEKIRAMKRELPDLMLTIVLDPLDAYDADEMEAAAVSARGESFLADRREAFDAQWQSVAERDPANICYTSGTTADPKGIILTHRNGQDAVLRLIEAELASYRDGGEHAGLFPGRWIPSVVAVLDEPFTEQNHLLNSTLKMVRGKILERYQGRIDELYTPQGRPILNDRNRAAIASLG